MSHEDPPASEIELEFAQEAEQIIAAHGGEEYFQEHFGFGREELQQTVVFGGHKSSAARMLTDEKCPIGGKLAEAYREGGTEAVQTKVNQLSEIAPEFTLTIANSSWQQAAKKKEPEPPLIEEPEFARVETTLAKPGQASTNLNIHQHVLHEELAARNYETKPDQAPSAAINESSDEPLQNETVSESPDSPKAKTTPDVELVADDVDTDEAIPTQVVQAASGQITPRPAIIAPQVKSLELTAPLIELPEVMNLRSEIVAEPVAATSLENEDSIKVDASLPTPLLAGESTPPPAESVVVTETVAVLVNVEALTSEQILQTEELVASLPAIVHDQLIEYMQSAEPEATEAAEVLVVSIAVAADRLHDLAMLDVLGSPEAEQIEVLIREWYEELLTKTGITFDEETIDQLIELIKSNDYGQDKGTHERKLSDSALPDGVTSAVVREQEIGRVAVQRLMTA